MSCSPNCSPQGKKLFTNQISNKLPATPSSPSISRGPGSSTRKRTTSASSSSPCSSRVTISSQLKINVKGSKRPINNEQANHQATSGTLKGQNQKWCRSNYGLNSDKVNNSAQSISNYEVEKKTQLKKDNGKTVKLRCQTPTSAGAKGLDKSKVHKNLHKSPSPPPLPAPSDFIASDSINVEHICKEEDTNATIIEKLKNKIGKHKFRSIKSPANKWTKSDKEMRNVNASSEKGLTTNEIAMVQANIGISLPYDNEFCCDDDNFYLIEKDQIKEKEVSTV